MMRAGDVATEQRDLAPEGDTELAAADGLEEPRFCGRMSRAHGRGALVEDAGALAEQV